MDSGVVDLNVLSSVCRFLILMPLPTEIPIAIESIIKTGEETSVQAASERGGTCFLYTSRFVSYRWYGQRRYCVLQEAHLLLGNKIESTL